MALISEQILAAAPSPKESQQEASPSQEQAQGKTPPKAEPEREDVPEFFKVTRGVLILNLAVGLVRLMQPFSFAWTAALAYTFFVLSSFEAWFDPPLKRVRLLCLPLILMAALWFTSAVVFATAPIEFLSYAMRSGDYAPGTVIGGISWDAHFTDLRVAVTNPSEADYQDLDLKFQPDKGTYKAALLGDAAGCDLISAGGNTVFATISKGGATKITTQKLGEGFDAHDNVGDLITPLLTDGGYRLRCSKFPARYTVRIVFALATVDPQLVSILTRPIPPGKMNLSYAEIAGPKSPFDMLNTKPSPTKVLVEGSYTNSMRKPYPIKTTVTINDGN